jgi:hypothetical protein
MTGRKWLIVAGILVAGWVAADTWRLAQKSRPRPATLDLHGTAYRITGPYAHANLAVFLIHSPTQDECEFITLDQGLKDGTVVITEKGEGQVSELVLDNQSDLPLFLQEGDRVQGGKQDRTIASSFVIPPKSGPSPLPAFCIEQGRWSGQSMLAGLDAASTSHAVFKFSGTSNAALAPKEVRQAAKLLADQSEVWENVRAQKAAARTVVMAPVTNSSLNETLDSPQVQKLSDEFANALGGVLKYHRDAVGVAIVVNGEIEEVNIYPNHKLLGKLYPRLLQSYALAAALQKDKAKDARQLAAADVSRFMTEGREQSRVSRQVDARNMLDVSYLDGAKAAARTSFQGQPVHVQVLSKAPAAKPAGQPAPQAPVNPPAPTPPPER